MLLDHEQVGTLLPDYLNGSLDKDMLKGVTEHLASCKDCSAELALLSEMTELDAPDPGELFWQTLPKRIAAQTERPLPWWKKLFEIMMRPVPIAVMTTLLLAVMLVPFATQYVGMPEQKEIVSPAEQVDIPKQQLQEIAGSAAANEQEVLALFENDDNGSSEYQQAIAALSAEELDELVQELQKSGGSGGDA